MGIIIDNISFSYGDKKVFENFSLTVPDGARLALRGASGSGKTTLLRLACGLLKPRLGSVSGYPATVGFVFQENRLIPTLTALENASIAGNAALAAEILGELGLAGELGAFPAELSGGMARRVALARALAHGSPLLILDEPFTGLDSELVRRAAGCVLKYAGDRTVLAVTHSDSEAELLGAEHVHIG